MNCHELATTLQNTLLRERSQLWFEEARQHAAHCPSCTRLLKLHRLEADIAELPAFEPSEAFVSTVMSRIMQPEPATVVSSPRFSWDVLRYPTMFVGALMLAVAYLLPQAGDSWLSSLCPSMGPVRLVGMSAYLAHHPWWALLLASIAAWLIVLGLAVPERQDPKMIVSSK